MDKSVRIVRLDIDEHDDFSGVDAIALVEQPAIEADFMYFSKVRPELFESYSDYPESVSNNAQRGIELNEKVGNKCATQVGKVRAQQLAKKEPISVETIKRMYSYLSRAEEYYDENDTEACGTISYLLWGGLSAKRWSEAKLKELGLFQGDIDVSALPDYVNEPSGSVIVKLDDCDCDSCTCAYAEIGPRGGVKKSPKAPKSKTPGDGKKGSDKNPKGAAGTTRGGIKIPKKVEESLQKKSDDFNERYKEKLGYGVNIGMLRAVYQRGVGAYQTSHSPEVSSAEQWGQARVNAFLYLVKEGRPQNKKYTTDYDLLPTKHPKRVENSKFVDPRAGENEAEFIGRCMESLEGEFPDRDQRLAVCYTSWRDRYESKVIEEYVEALFDFLGYLDGLPVFSTKEEAAEVAEIAGCKGYHEHEVGPFTVYMPCESHDKDYDDLLKEAVEEWQKSKMKSWNDLSEEELDGILSYLDEVGEDVMFSQDTFAGVTGGKQRRNVGDSVSFLDTPTTKIRYRYVVNPKAPSNKSGNSRDFCKALMRKPNVVYRKEDINNASFAGANPGFGPNGTNQYNLFLYRGGNNCRHIWEEVRFELKNGKWVDSTKSVTSIADLIKPRVPQTTLEPTTIGSLGIGTQFSKEEFADQQMLVGPAMVPDKLIYRIDMDGEYYVYFPKEAIKKIAYKYMENQYTDSANIEHNSNDPLKDIFVVESWIVTDPKRDKSVVYTGQEYPEGTWMVAMKVKNKQVWDEYVKTGKVKGFSVEGFFIDQLMNKK